jgi:hypothetical protein
MSTAPAFDLALNDMLNAYKADSDSKNDASIKLVKAATDKVKPSKVKAVKVKTPASNGEATVIVVAPKEKLDAKGFLAAQREAGYRLDDNGKRYFSQADQRDDQIKAIDAFIGYDGRKDFASQELAARSQAIRELRKAQGEDLTAGPDRSEKRRVNASLSGYVAGMPDNQGKDLAHLRARERLAVSTLIEQDAKTATAAGSRYVGAEVMARMSDDQKPVTNKQAPDQERAKAAAFAQLEAERLQEIRRDLAVHGK